MKKLITITMLLLSASVFSQTRVINSKLKVKDTIISEEGIKLQNATENTNPLRLPIMDANGLVKDYIGANTLFQNFELDNQQITDFSIVSDSLKITLERGNTKSVNLSGYLDNTDSQTWLQITGSQTTIDLSGFNNDLDLSDFTNTTNFVKDADITSYNPTGHLLMSINGKDIRETITQLETPTLTGKVITLKFKNENDVVQTVNLDLTPALPTQDNQINNASYDASANVITLTDNNSNTFTVDLSEFSIISTTNSNGTTTLDQEGVTKVTISEVGQTGDYGDILNPPTIPTNNNQIANGANYITSPDGGNANQLNGFSATDFVKRTGDVDETVTGIKTFEDFELRNGKGNALKIINSFSGNWSTGDLIGKIPFIIEDASGIGEREVASIEAVSDQVGSTTDGNLDFYASVNNATKIKIVRISKLGIETFGNSTANKFLSPTDIATTSLTVDTTNCTGTLEYKLSNNIFLIRGTITANAGFNGNTKIATIPDVNARPDKDRYILGCIENTDFTNLSAIEIKTNGEVTANISGSTTYYIDVEISVLKTTY